jgi:DNA-binding IclR family transcriptional regulator
VTRAMDLLILSGEKPAGLSLADAVATTGLPKTTVLRLLVTLEQQGLLWNVGSRTYVPGPALLHLAETAADTWRLRPDLATMLNDLAEELHETVNLWIRRGLTRVCIAQAQSGRSLRHVIRVGDQLPLTSGASAKVLLTGAPTELIDDVAAADEMEPAGADELRNGVEHVRSSGWSISHGEHEEGLSALSVPIRSSKGATVACLTISGPTVRFAPARVEDFLPALRECADEVGRRGFEPHR